MIYSRSSSSSSSAGLVVVLLGACIAAAGATTSPTMGYQSWACRSPIQPAGSNAATPVSPYPTPAGPVNQGWEQSAAAVTATRFLYNLAWGPPNYYIVNPATGNPQTIATQAAAIDALINRPAPTGNNIEWSATISTATANGYPFGCCGGSIPVAVTELGCKNCISGTQNLPSALTMTPAVAFANQVVSCNGAGQQCSSSAYVPTVGSSVISLYTDAITTGSGATTLNFPSQTGAVLAAGVYTFSLWAESICGVVMSSNVTLAARCPPSPTVVALLRQPIPQGSPAGTPTAPLTPNADGSYNVTVGAGAVVDASCSFPYQINKPNWPLTQSSNFATAGYNPTRNLYAIQKIYFNVANTVSTTLSVTSVTATAQTFNTAPLQNYWASSVTFNVAGPHTILVTVTDGCSASQSTIRVNAVCTCQPVAKAMFVQTIWSNGAANTNLNNFANSGTTLSTASVPPAATDMLNVPSPLYTFALTGSAYDYETSNGGAGALAYDWNFVYWAPDYSPMINKGASVGNLGNSLATNYLMAPNTLWPPSSGSVCSPTGEVPLPCANSWWGLSTDRCCFSASRDLVTDVSTVVRPAKGAYVYKVLLVQTSPGTALRQLAAGRTKVYNFMRISSGCNSTAPGGTFDWVTISFSSAVDAGVAATTTYYALPLFLQAALTANPLNQMTSNQNYQDFNGFPYVNAGAGANPVFRPTTECGAWLKAQTTNFIYTEVQSRVNFTVTCGRNTDLVLCRVTITNTNVLQNTATLSVSSYGSCKGQWQFSLTVDDSCQMSTDYFNLNVGCNRAPVVSAGCANTQTWSALGGAAKFEQISLDGRASYDPDNFVDGFYNLNVGAAADTYPGCITGAAGAGTCATGGLGLYGLTYAWALISYFNSQNVLVYSSVTGNIANCPTTTNNMQSLCADSYCAAPFTYPLVNSWTRQYDPSLFQTDTTLAGKARTSPQGGLMLGEAWQTGFYAVTTVQFGQANSNNLMPVIDNLGSSMTQQMVFPDFNANCAPTVYPIFLPTLTGTPAFFGTAPADNNQWAYAQQVKHVGNSAYMVGLTNAGMYTARLYAFDGCSVGFADVTFTLECPSMPNPDGNWNLANSYIYGDTTVSYLPPAFVVTYGGTQEIAVGGTIQVFAAPGGVLNSTAPVAGFACTMTQQTPVGAASRTMNVASCNNLLWTSPTATTWLPPGTYRMVATFTDGCNRGVSVTNISPAFTVNCQTATLTLTTPPVVATRTITYAVATTGGNFGSGLSFGVGANTNATNVVVSWMVYWRPVQSPTAANTNDNNGGAAGFLTNFFTDATASTPKPGVFLVYASSFTGAPASIPTVTAPGGTKSITFTNTAPGALAARTATDAAANTGLFYNTVIDGSQAGFAVNRATGAVFWHGEYYVRVSLSAAGAGAACPSNAGAADQYFTAFCQGVIDPTGNVTAASVWAPGGTNLFTPSYFNNAPWEPTGNYCPGGGQPSDSYCETASGASTGGMFRSFTLTQAVSGNVFTNSPGGSIAYRISYRAPFAVVPTPTVTTVTAGNQVQFTAQFQNPLLFSPFSYLNLATPAAQVTRAWAGNTAAGQLVELNIPGTWTVDVFNTNGCQNRTGGSIDLVSYCYDDQMPEAGLTFQVVARNPPAGCNATFQIASDQCDVTNLQMLPCTGAQTFKAVRGPLVHPTGTTFARRRLVPEEEEAAVADESSAKEEHIKTGRRLLQTGSPVTNGVCASNTNFLQAAAIGSLAFNIPAGSATPGSSVAASAAYGSLSGTPYLAPNFAAQVTSFYNSFDINPTYTPSNTDLRNFYGMGDLFSDGKILFTTGANTAVGSFQGAFDQVTVQIDNTKASVRTPMAGTANGNNANVNWFALNNWIGTYTSSSTAAPSFTSAAPVANFPSTSYSALCSWAPIGSLVVDSFNPAYNAVRDVSMSLQGCTPLVFSQQVGPNSNPSNKLQVSSLANGGNAATNLFTWQAAGTLPSGRSATKAGNYDYVAVAWNGPVGRSCYDYRAVRVVAICNRLVPFDVTPGNGGNTYRTQTTEGPLLIAALGSNPSQVTKAAPYSFTSNWMTGMFDSVNITGGFKYLQCGNANANLANLPGGTDPAGMLCSAMPGSKDGEGNYYSLRYSWNVWSAPVGSIFYPLTSWSNVTNSYVQGSATLFNSTTDTSDPDRTVTTQTFRRTNTWSQVQTTRQVKLLNHGYRNPTTTFRPDIEGTYIISLMIEDGCSTWQSVNVTVTSSCVRLDSQTVLGTFDKFVRLTIPSNVAGVNPTTAGAPGVLPVYNVQIDGSQYTRITMNAAAGMPAAASGTYYYTYMWAVTLVSPLPGQGTFTPTNMQGTVASFVPTDLADAVLAVYDNLQFRVDLMIRTNCMTANGPYQVTFSALVNVQCTLAGVSSANFNFYPPYVNTYAQYPQLFWGLGTPNNVPTTPLSEFANVQIPATNNKAGLANINPASLYYRQNVVLRTGAAATPGAPLLCDPMGPYCAPNGQNTSTIPTILFGGSVPQGTGNANNQPDNTAYAQVNGVWGAGWQGLYFSVPASLTPNLCKIKSTYWVLVGYQNALPFVPQYVPVQQTVAPTCTPVQKWSWTVIATPCQRCDCNGAGSTCSTFDLDTCDFTPNYLYTYMSVNNPAGLASPAQIVNTGYRAPTFNVINPPGTFTPGTQPTPWQAGSSLNPYCVYDAGNRLSGLPNINNLRTNCRVSGRGLAVDISQTASCTTQDALTGNNLPTGIVSANPSIACPMSSIAFVPGFPGSYSLQLSVYDGCGSPTLQTVNINAQCRLRPTVQLLQQNITSFYDCADQGAQSSWGNPSQTGGPFSGRFGPVTMSSLVAQAGITSVQDANQIPPSPRSGACAVAAPTTTMNCTDVRNYVNNQNVMVDVADGTNNKFKACCQCLYGSQTINLFGGSGGTTPTGKTPAPSVVPGSTTQQNVLALDDAEYNRNSIILIALVTPLAVLLVGSLAGNVLMALKMRQGGASAGSYNVRAGDVELSTSPRVRVDV